MWVLGIKLWFSARAASAFNYRAIQQSTKQEHADKQDVLGSLGYLRSLVKLIVYHRYPVSHYVFHRFNPRQ